ncbi:MAG: periplasmic heavy metal sensor, partial [Planctomycetes bacterium]|nr:periplasmic heavy metal sensor [Planctomycetota bacterium]
MRRLLPTLAALAALLLVLAPDADAQRSGRQAGRSPKAGLERKAERLGLTEAQRDQVRSSVQQHRDTLQALRDSVRDAHDALRQVLDAAP